jgi:hypothetical protein
MRSKELSEPWPEDKEQEWPRPSPENIAKALSAPPTWIDRLAPRLIGLAIGLPWLIMLAVMVFSASGNSKRQPGPVTETTIEGYRLDYRPTLHRCGNAGGQCTGSTEYYMGLAADGSCHTVLYPADWDAGMCAIRLRQIEANDCRAVPDNDDAFCRQMLADLAAPGASKRKVRLTLVMQRGRVVDWKPAK